MKYKHISQKERDQMYDLLQQGCQQSEIATILDRHRATIRRELRRNSTCIDRRFNGCKNKKRYYLPDRAQVKYENRRKHAKTTYPLKNPFIYTYTLAHLKIGWSPEMISGKIKKDHKQEISHECIYRYIYGKHAKEKGYNLWEYLIRSHQKRRRKHGRKGKRMLIPNRIGIEQRPAIVETRERLGDWEGDTIFGKGQGAALATFNERKDKIIKIKKLLRKTAKEMEMAADRVFKSIPKEIRLTITLDNGPENTLHQEISRNTGLQVYFAHPYHSWERGGNERGNGIMRRYFPKGTSFDNISEEEIYLVQELINNRPMKCLDWKTPNEAYQEHLSQLLSPS